MLILSPIFNRNTKKKTDKPCTRCRAILAIPWKIRKYGKGCPSQGWEGPRTTCHTRRGMLVLRSQAEPVPSLGTLPGRGQGLGQQGLARPWNGRGEEGARLTAWRGHGHSGRGGGACDARPPRGPGREGVLLLEAADAAGVGVLPRRRLEVEQCLHAELRGPGAGRRRRDGYGASPALRCVQTRQKLGHGGIRTHAAKTMAT